MHRSTGFIWAWRAHDISMKQYFDRPLTLGIVILSNWILLKMGLSFARRSSSLALNAKFPTYSLAYVLFPSGSRCTAWLTRSRADSNLAFAASLSFSGNSGTTKLSSFLYRWDLSLRSSPQDLLNSCEYQLTVVVRALILANLLNCPICAEPTSDDLSENDLGMFLALLLNYLNCHLAMSLGLILTENYPVQYNSALMLIDSL